MLPISSPPFQTNVSRDAAEEGFCLTSRNFSYLPFHLWRYNYSPPDSTIDYRPHPSIRQICFIVLVFRRGLEWLGCVPSRAYLTLADRALQNHWIRFAPCRLSAYHCSLRCQSVLSYTHGEHRDLSTDPISRQYRRCCLVHYFQQFESPQRNAFC